MNKDDRSFRNLPKVDSLCVVHPDGTVENSSIHEELLSGISPEDEAKQRRWFIEECKKLGMTDEEIALLI